MLLNQNIKLTIKNKYKINHLHSIIRLPCVFNWKNSFRGRNEAYYRWGEVYSKIVSMKLYVSELNLQLFHVNHAGFLIRCSGKAYKPKDEMKT